MNGKEIVITGMGVVSPIANELNLFWEGIKSGRSGISRVESMEDIDQFQFKLQVKFVNLILKNIWIQKKQKSILLPPMVLLLRWQLKILVLINFYLIKKEAGVLVSSGIGGMKYLQTQHKRALEGGKKSFSAIDSSNDYKYFVWLYLYEV